LQASTVNNRGRKAALCFRD